MAGPTVTELWNGLEFGFDGGAGYTRRTFLIEGLTNIALTNPSDIFGLNWGLSGLPGYMEAHPTIRNLFCSGVRGIPCPDHLEEGIARTSVKLFFDYATPTLSRPLGGTYVELGGSNGMIIKNRWEFADENPAAKGKSILVGYNPTDGSSFPGNIDPATVVPQDPNGNRYDSVSFPRESPNVIITIARTVYSALADQDVRNTLNQNDWMGLDALTVFCRDVRCQKVFGCGWYRDHFVQQIILEASDDPNYWQDVGFFLDEHTGKPVVCDVLDGTNNGYVWVGRPQTDFNTLGLPNDLFVPA